MDQAYSEDDEKKLKKNLRKNLLFAELALSSRRTLKCVRLFLFV